MPFRAHNCNLYPHPTQNSPEVASLPVNGAGYADGRASDIWSLGVTLYTVLMASLPWNTPLPADPYYSEYTMRRRSGEVGAVFGHSPQARKVFTKALGELFDRYVSALLRAFPSS